MITAESLPARYGSMFYLILPLFALLLGTGVLNVVLFPFLLPEFNIKLKEYGLMESLEYIGSLPSFIILFFLVAFFRRLTLVFYGMVIWIAGIIFCSQAKTFGALVASRLISGFGFAPLLSFIPLLVNDIAPASHKGLCVGLLTALSGVGAILSTKFSNHVITETGSWRGAFLYSTFVMNAALVIGIPLWAIISKQEKSKSNTTGRQTNQDPELQQPPQSSSSKPARQQLFSLSVILPVAVYLLAMAGATFTRSAITVFEQPWMRRHFFIFAQNKIDDDLRSSLCFSYLLATPIFAIAYEISLRIRSPITRQARCQMALAFLFVLYLLAMIPGYVALGYTEMADKHKFLVAWGFCKAFLTAAQPMQYLAIINAVPSQYASYAVVLNGLIADGLGECLGPVAFVHLTDFLEDHLLQSIKKCFIPLDVAIGLALVACIASFMLRREPETDDRESFDHQTTVNPGYAKMQMTNYGGL